MTIPDSPKRRNIVLKNPDLNPYVAELERYEKFIWSRDPEEIEEFEDYLKSQPIVLDLGCGSGNFLRDMARAMPHRNYLGFELRYKRLVLGARKIQKWGIENVRLVQARAEEIAEWFVPGSVHQIHVNFPDPWPKTRHRKNRMIQPKFLDTLKMQLEKGGNFQFKTDHREYFAEALGTFEASEEFEVCELSWDLHNSEFKASNINTEFESLFLSKGLPVYYLKALPKG